MSGLSAAREAALALLGFTLLAAVLFVPPLYGGNVPSFRDLADYAIPQKLFSVSELLHGRLPLWNPYGYFGFPHLAALQSQVLYPPNLLLLLPFPLGYNLSLALHFPLAAAGAFLLARALGRSPAAAALAGAGYGVAPFLVSLIDLNAFLFTSCWLPWQLLCGVALGRCPSVRRMALTALVFALAFLAGEPQTFAVASLLSAVASVLAAWSVRGAWRERLLPLLVAWPAAALVTVLLCAPALLPFLELVGHSERSGAGLTRAAVFRYSVEPHALLTLALPGYAGDVVRGTHWLGQQTYVRRPYLGVVLLSLAAAGLTRRRKLTWLLLAVCAGSILLALGPDGLLYPILYDLGFRQSRFPVKFLVFGVLAVALLAAFGADRVCAAGRSADARRRPRRALAAAALAATLGLVVALSVPHPPARAAGTHAAVAGALLLAVIAGGRHLRRSSGWALAALAAADLMYAAAPLVVVSAADVYRAPTPAVAALAGAERVYNPQISAAALAWVYRDGVHDDAALQRKKSLLFGNFPLLFATEAVRSGESVVIRWTAEVVELVDRGPPARPLLDRLGVTHVLSRHDLTPLGLRRAAATGGVQVYRNPTARPRARLTGRTERVDDAARRRARLLAGGRDGPVLVEEELPGLAPACDAGTVRQTARTPRRVEWEVTSPGRCLLVVYDAWYPGWRAYTDGERRPLHRVDHAFRGVVVEPGPQRVRMEYRPHSFAIGRSLLAVGGGLLLLALLVAEAARRQESM